MEIALRNNSGTCDIKKCITLAEFKRITGHNICFSKLKKEKDDYGDYLTNGDEEFRAAYLKAVDGSSLFIGYELGNNYEELPNTAAYLIEF